MIAATRRPKLYGPNGKPLALGVYPSPTQHPHQNRPRRNLARDMRANISEYDRWSLCNYSLQLYAGVSNLGTSVNDKNAWAFLDGWEPNYTGTNQKWGDEAATFLRQQWWPNCDRRGRYDWNTLLYLSGIAQDVIGDDLMILTEDNNGSGFPKIDFIPGTRIGSGLKQSGSKVDGGPFDGNRIIDGVIFDDTDTPVAVRVLGAGEDGNETVLDVGIGFGGRADFAYQPELQEQGRGVPLVARCSLDWMDLEDIDTFLKRGIKRAASVGLIHKNKEGQAAVGNEILIEETISDSTGANQTVTLEEVEGGEAYYLRADGENIEGLDYKTPHPNVENFIARVERRGIRAVGWAYELLNLAESGRAATRLVCELGNNSIWKQQRIGLRRTWRAVRYALAKAMKNGFISRNPDPMDAYFAWEFGLPKELSVDQGNDQQADRENLKMGTTNKAILAAKSGRHWREIGVQRKKEIVTNAQDAMEIERSTGGKLSFDKAFELLEQRAANPTAQQPQQPEKPEPDAKDEEQP